jgi:hypothetical protein
MKKHLNKARDTYTNFISDDNNSKTYGFYINNKSKSSEGVLTFIYHKKKK